jgi:predicted dehydrogenase
VATVAAAESGSTAPLRLGLVGLGVVAQAVHLPLIAKHPDRFRTTALCDLSPLFPVPYLLHAPTVLTVVDADGEGERRSESRWTAEAFERQWLAFADFARGGSAPRAAIAEGRADIVACQAATALIAARRGINVGGEAAGGGAGGSFLDGYRQLDEQKGGAR